MRWRIRGVRHRYVKFDILISHTSGNEKYPAVYINLNLRGQVQPGAAKFFQHINGINIIR